MCYNSHEFERFELQKKEALIRLPVKIDHSRLLRLARGQLLPVMLAGGCLPSQRGRDIGNQGEDADGVD